MVVRAAVAFAVSVLVVLLVGALLRSLARRRKRRWPRRSAGVALVCALPVGLLAAARITDVAVVVAVGALAAAGFGVVSDEADVPRWVSGAALVAIAVGVTAASGLRFPLAGVPSVDVAWTVVWLVLVSLAVAGSGTADGQMPIMAAALALGLVAMALFADQGSPAALLAAVLGAVVAFLAYNFRPASLYVGRAGALFVGVITAAGALWVQPAVGRPESLLVRVMLVAVPLLDGLLVVGSRIRRGRPLTVRIRDHLSHRLVAGGMGPGLMIVVLALAQVVIGMLALFVGRRVLAPAPGALLAGALLVVLAGLALPARMRTEGRRPGGRVLLVISGVVAFCVVATIPAAAAALASQAKVSSARSTATQAIRAARAGDTTRATSLFARAERDFAAADDRLSSLITAPSLLVPLVGSNVYAAQKLAHTGRELARAGIELSQGVTTEQLRFVDGRVPLDTVATVGPKLAAAARTLRESDRTLRHVRTPYLVGQLRDGLVKLRRQLDGAARDAARAAATARVAPGVLGADTPRHYLLLVQNPAELRGTGGLIGNWGIVTAQNGSLHLDSLERTSVFNASGNPAARTLNAPADYVSRYGRFDPARTFQNVNISPDFPTVAAVAADLYHQASGQTVDGVLAVDPLGLAALLSLTGPVRVPDWKTPVSADNVVDVTLRDAYVAYARTPERADFLGEVARATVDKATTGELGNVAQMSRVLGPAAHEGHLAVWFADPAAEAIVQEIGISGKVPSVTGDSLHVSDTNAGANKLDYYLERTIDYSVTVTPSADWKAARTQGTIGVTLANSVPPSGVPQIAAGPYEGLMSTLVYGQNHTYQSVYTPLTLTGAALGGQAIGVEGTRELGRNVYSAYVDVFSQGNAILTLEVAGDVGLRSGGWYDLTLVRQPTLRADKVNVGIAVPPGFEILATRGLALEGGQAAGTIMLSQNRTVSVRIGATSGNVWDRLVSGNG